MARPPASTLMTALGFTRAQERLYEQVLAQSGRRVAEVANALLVDEADLLRDLAPLVERNVVRRRDDRLLVAGPSEVLRNQLTALADGALRARERLDDVAAAVPFLAASSARADEAALDQVQAIDGEVSRGGEVLPLMRQHGGTARVGVTGCSFGAYHAVNFALRHPDMVSACAGLSGAYDIHSFLDGYYDDVCYFHCPVDSLPNNNDDWYLGQYRHDIRWVLAAGEHDICLDATRRLAGIFQSKGIPHRFDCWGYGAYHDWPLWHEMIWKYFGW